MTTEKTEPVQNTTEGRIIHVRKPDVSHCIPAIVVRTWGLTTNVLLFPDGSNDGYTPVGADPKHGPAYGLVWMTSVDHEDFTAEGSPSWHWPERV